MSLEMHEGAPSEDRSVIASMWRGFTCRCPNCGEGRLFAGYLTVARECDHCGEDFTGEEAHDFPPYITVFIVAHIIGTVIMIAEATFDWSMLTHILVWSVLTLVLCFAMMKPVKGAVVGLQWALRMAGFGDEPDGAHAAYREEQPKA